MTAHKSNADAAAHDASVRIDDADVTAAQDRMVTHAQGDVIGWATQLADAQLAREHADGKIAKAAAAMAEAEANVATCDAEVERCAAELEAARAALAALMED